MKEKKNFVYTRGKKPKQKKKSIFIGPERRHTFSQDDRTKGTQNQGRKETQPKDGRPST